MLSKIGSRPTAAEQSVMKHGSYYSKNMIDKGRMKLCSCGWSGIVSKLRQHKLGIYTGVSSVVAGLYGMTLFGMNIIRGDVTNMWIVIAATAAFVLHFQYIRDLLSSKYLTVVWNADKIVWNSFLLVVVNCASVFSGMYFLIKSKNYGGISEMIGELNPLDLFLFVSLPVLDGILSGLFVLYIKYHHDMILAAGIENRPDRPDGSTKSHPASLAAQP